MRKILILGGSHRDIPLIEAAKEMGHYVVTLGSKLYYIGHRYADNFYRVDFNDTSAVMEIVEREGISAIVAGCSEAAYLQAVRLSERLGSGSYDRYETAAMLHDKWAFKSFALRNGIPTPGGVMVEEGGAIPQVSLPAVVKPARLSGGRGVRVVRSVEALQGAVSEAFQNDSRVFVEEFVEGELIAFSVFLRGRKVIYAFSGKDDTYLNPYLITTAYPVGLKDELRRKLVSSIEKMSNLLDLVDGMFHFQVLVSDDTPYIIDITRRIPGDLYPKLIEFCDGVAYSRGVVKAYLGEEVSDEFVPTRPGRFVVRHCVMPGKNGRYKGVHIPAFLREKVLYRLDLVEPGTRIDDCLHAQLAILLFEIDGEEKNLLKNINETIYAIMEQ